MKGLLTTILLLLCTAVGAQNAEKLYTEGKALYDAKNYTQAFPKLKAAAEKGHKKAQYRLGRCYDKGNGVAEDDKQAFIWYSKAAAQGNAKAQYQVGKCYKNGEGVAKDQAKAFQYFSKAAKQGNGDAQLALGKCYLKGKGTKVDKVKAKAWFQKAVKNEKDGKEVQDHLRKELADGDEDAKVIMKMVGMK
ncbi:MAG: sel1 repeat family protein [Prevotella sp.]|nr:sel1 repeat family protein [Prevotella sp.]